MCVSGKHNLHVIMEKTKSDHVQQYPMRNLSEQYIPFCILG
jgi:hypothetical protein